MDNMDNTIKPIVIKSSDIVKTTSGNVQRSHHFNPMLRRFSTTSIPTTATAHPHSSGNFMLTANNPEDSATTVNIAQQKVGQPQNARILIPTTIGTGRLFISNTSTCSNIIRTSPCIIQQQSNKTNAILPASIPTCSNIIRTPSSINQQQSNKTNTILPGSVATCSNIIRAPSCIIQQQSNKTNAIVPGSISALSGKGKVLVSTSGSCASIGQNVQQQQQQQLQQPQSLNKSIILSKNSLTNTIGGTGKILIGTNIANNSSVNFNGQNIIKGQSILIKNQSSPTSISIAKNINPSTTIPLKSGTGVYVIRDANNKFVPIKLATTTAPAISTTESQVIVTKSQSTPITISSNKPNSLESILNCPGKKVTIQGISILRNQQLQSHDILNSSDGPLNKIPKLQSITTSSLLESSSPAQSTATNSTTLITSGNHAKSIQTSISNNLPPHTQMYTAYANPTQTKPQIKIPLQSSTLKNSTSSSIVTKTDLQKDSILIIPASLLPEIKHSPKTPPVESVTAPSSSIPNILNNTSITASTPSISSTDVTKLDQKCSSLSQSTNNPTISNESESQLFVTKTDVDFEKKIEDVSNDSIQQQLSILTEKLATETDELLNSMINPPSSSAPETSSINPPSSTPEISSINPPLLSIPETSIDPPSSSIHETSSMNPPSSLIPETSSMNPPSSFIPETSSINPPSSFTPETSSINPRSPSTPQTSSSPVMFTTQSSITLTTETITTTATTSTTIISATTTKSPIINKIEENNESNDSEKNKNDKSLICDEKLQVSPTNGSENSTDDDDDKQPPVKMAKIDSTDSTNSLPEKEQKQVEKNVIINGLEKIELERRLIDILQQEKEQANKNIESKKIRSSDLGFLQWSKDGTTGYTKDRRIEFHLDSLGLLTVSNCSNTQRSKRNSKTVEDDYEKLLQNDFNELLKAREELVNTISCEQNNLEKITCKGCGANREIRSFLTSEYCSYRCYHFFGNKESVHALRMVKPRINKQQIDTQKSFNLTKNLNTETKSNAKSFNWQSYLNLRKGVPAPIELFSNPFPNNCNLFKPGMKLEAIDPKHQSLFCVCTITKTQGYRLKLHFDGYSSRFDFWVNADSCQIFPPNFCETTLRKLEKPRGISDSEFVWDKYLKQTRTVPAPAELFKHLKGSKSTENPFEIGMKVEAEDVNRPNRVYVATIADKIKNRILIHFDGKSRSYDFWTDSDSPYIHPINWHKKHTHYIFSPPCKNFHWSNYLKKKRAIETPSDIFKTRGPLNFKPGMRIEVVDRKTPEIIRPALIVTRKNCRIKILYEGWPSMYAYWINDNDPDIHPIRWCESTGHDLEPPPGFQDTAKASCPMRLCRGIGNINCNLQCHATTNYCPYSMKYWSFELGDSDDRLAKNNKKQSENDNSSDKKIYKRKHSEIETDKQKQEIIDSDKKETIASALDDPIKTLQNNNSFELVFKYIDKSLINKSPITWNLNEIFNVIKNITASNDIAEKFIEHKIDGFLLLAIEKSDLINIMQIKVGPAMKINNFIVCLREYTVANFLKKQ